MHSLSDIHETFDLVDDWEERYQILIDLGKSLPPMEDALKNDANKVEGCVSQVWLHADNSDAASIHFIADSDAHIVRGLIGLLLIAYQDKSASDILAIDIDEEFQKLGLEKHLSPNRRSGFYAMVGRIRTIAENASA